MRHIGFLATAYDAVIHRRTLKGVKGGMMLSGSDLSNSRLQLAKRGDVHIKVVVLEELVKHGEHDVCLAMLAISQQQDRLRHGGPVPCS